MSEIIKLEKVKANGLSFNVALAGPVDGIPVILLHGFPDAWFGWRPQIERLSKSGFRVIAPDQRGYNTSDKPESIDEYRIDNLVEDVVSIASELGHEKFALAGHDWGAGVAWMVALKYRDRVSHLSILNVPHPKVFQSYVRKQFSQMLKSWYILFFQVPRLPEILSRMNNWYVVLNQMPGLDEEEKEEYRKAWSQPGAFTAMLNWYRAAVRHEPKELGEAILDIPTLIIWGKEDRYLDYEMAELSLDYLSNGSLKLLQDASHWVMYDESEKVSSLLIEHFSK